MEEVKAMGNSIQGNSIKPHKRQVKAKRALIWGSTTNVQMTGIKGNSWAVAAADEVGETKRDNRIEFKKTNVRFSHTRATEGGGLVAICMGMLAKRERGKKEKRVKQS